MRIVLPETPEQWDQVRGLFSEYWASFDLSPCFQNFAVELAGLPGDYAPPRGSLALAMVDGEPAGCAAIRPFDAGRGEFKRLFVRPAFRGRGVGRGLMEWVIDEARRLGYSELVADTLPQMTEALAMYDRAGFERTEAYAATPTPGAIYLRFTL
jgi:putative acetyltransferase